MAEKKVLTSTEKMLCNRTGAKFLSRDSCSPVVTLWNGRPARHESENAVVYGLTDTVEDVASMSATLFPSVQEGELVEVPQTVKISGEWAGLVVVHVDHEFDETKMPPWDTIKERFLEKMTDGLREILQEELDDEMTVTVKKLHAVIHWEGIDEVPEWVKEAEPT